MDNWYPGKSTPSQDEWQDSGGRGWEQPPEPNDISRKSTKIVRRKHPTVDPRIKEAIVENADEQKTESAWDPLLETATVPIRPAPTSGFCRWQEKEKTAGAHEENGFSAQYREVSLRGGRRKGCPRFQHLPDATAYIEAYRPYGYTSICAQASRPLPARSNPQDHDIAEEKCESRAEEQDAPKEKQTSAPIGEKAREGGLAPGDRERRTRSYLHELAMRLGVRDSLRDYYLMAAVLPSPPSITKNRQIDFVLCAHGTIKNSNLNGNDKEVDEGEEQEPLERKTSCTELPPIPAAPKLTRCDSGEASSQDNSSDCRPPEHQVQPPKDPPSTPKKGESYSREAILLRTAQSLGLASRKWLSRKHDRPVEDPEQGSTYASVSRGSAHDENKTSSLDDVPGARGARQNSSRNVARSPASGEFVAQEKRGREDSAPPIRRPSGNAQFTSVMRPQKLSRARRKLTTALSTASIEQDKPPPQINGILGIHRHRLIPP